MRHEAFDTGFIDLRSLSPAQREALRRRLIDEAHAARRGAIRRTFAGVFTRLRRLRPAAMVQAMRNALDTVWAAHICERDRLEGLASLRAMTDYELRDIGLSRSAVRAAAFADEKDATSQDCRPL